MPKAQMVPRQDWSYVAGAKANLQGAHERDSAISCLRFSADNNTLLSRCGDDTLKVGSDGGQVWKIVHNCFQHHKPPQARFFSSVVAPRCLFTHSC